MTNKQPLKSVEDLAGEIWRCIKNDFEKDGIELPDSWKGVGMAYGGYSRAIELIHSYTAERESDETIICNREGVHTCRKNAVHVPDNFCGKLSTLLNKN